jgi:hypothetical protein
MEFPLRTYFGQNSMRLAEQRVVVLRTNCDLRRLPAGAKSVNRSTSPGCTVSNRTRNRKKSNLRNGAADSDLP